MRWFFAAAGCFVLTLVHILSALFAAPRSGFAVTLWTTDIALWAGLTMLTFQAGHKKVRSQ